MQIRRFVPCFRQIRQSANIFVHIRKVNVSATVASNFAQIVKKVTRLMTITQYNSNNSHTPEFKWNAFSKNEIIWMNSLTYRPRLKKDLWSKFWLWPMIKHQDRHDPESVPKSTADPRSMVFLKSANPLDLRQKIQNPESSVRRMWLGGIFKYHCYHRVVFTNRNKVTGCPKLLRRRTEIMSQKIPSEYATFTLCSSICYDLWPDLIFWACAYYSSRILSQSDLIDLTENPWIADFRYWTGTEVAILGADQKNWGLWGRKWKNCWLLSADTRVVDKLCAGYKFPARLQRAIV